MRRSSLVIALLATSLLGGCASWFEGSNQFKPTPLQAVKTQQNLQLRWSISQAGPGNSFLPIYRDGEIISADAAGYVRTLDSATGRRVAQLDLKRKLSAGVGVSDELVLVGTQDATLLAADRSTGQKVWEQPLTSLMLEAPQVVGNIVVVRTNDGRITGFSLKDAGKQQWSQVNVLPQLTVRNTGAMQAVGNEAIMVGQAAGRLEIMSPTTGSSIWQSLIASPRGATELERASDIVSRPVFDGGQVCAVAYQGRIACLDARNGSIIWAKELSSGRGLTVDERNAYTTAEDGTIWAYNRSNGNMVWKSDALKYRNVSGPAILGSYILVTDGEGYAHLLSNYDGSIVGRVKAGSDILNIQPLSLGTSALIQGQNGYLALLTLN